MKNKPRGKALIVTYRGKLCYDLHFNVVKQTAKRFIPYYTDDFRNQVLKVLEEPPPDGLFCWDGPSVAKRINTSVHAVWRLLRKEGIYL